MPVQPTFPGVYIEEVPSGVRTITGVATSITAFIGRAQRGPVNQPVTINNFADFERVFAGLWEHSTISFAVRDFYLNGGSRAIIVRLFRFLIQDAADEQSAQQAAQAVADAATTAAAEPDASANSVATAAEVKAREFTTEPQKTAARFVAMAARDAAEIQDPEPTPTSVKDAAIAAVDHAATLKDKAQLQLDTLTLEAAYEGSWGNKLTAQIDHDVLGSNILFNLSVTDTGIEQTEQFRNLSVDPEHPRAIDKVLQQESRLIRVFGEMPAARPAPTDSIRVLPEGMASDGRELETDDYTGSQLNKEGIFVLEDADLFNILCIPPYSPITDVDKSVWATAVDYCKERRAMLIIDSPDKWKTKDDAKSGLADDINLTHKNAAIFFPRFKQPNPTRDNQIEEFVPCGAVAGIFARTDGERGVWKAPAGLDAILRGVPELTVRLTDEENGELNPLGINCLRFKQPAGRVVWGARTREGDDRLASEWKYIPVRRTALFLEESLFRGTQFVVFEPNDEPLWAQIRLNVGAFMQNLFLQGAFQGSTPREAYLVKCDSETTTQNDINLGIVNILVGFAPLKPAEFVFIKIQQLAGQIEV